MNNEKIGLFIKQLREEKLLSQEGLGLLVNVTRQAVSKWERGISAPDSLTLKLLSEIFKVSIDELIAGERRSSNNSQKCQETLLNIYDENFKKLKLIKKLSSIILLIVLFFLCYYFVNTYNKTNIYLISGATNNFKMRNGIFLTTTNKFYFRLGTLYNEKNKKVSEYHLYYKNEAQEEKTIFKSDDFSALLVDDYGYNGYFEYDYLSLIIKNLYLDITYDGITETMKLNLNKNFSNNYLIFLKKSEISKEKIDINKSNNVTMAKSDLAQIIKNHFIVKKDKIYYQFENNIFEYIEEINLLRMENKIKENIWLYYIKNEMFSVEIIENREKINTCWYKENLIKCEKENPEKIKEEFGYFEEQLKKLLKHFSKGN